MRTATVRRPLAAIAALTTALLTLTACSPEEDKDNVLTVFAAASLTKAFNLIADQFEEEHPDSGIVFNFAGSSALAAQIAEGAPGDVFAAADETTMAAAVDAGTVADPEVFARNQLVIAVPEGNPDGVTGLQDLADLSVAVCAEEVPCGAAAQTVIAASGASITPSTYEPDVKATLAKLAMGEADAALVYRTDVKAAWGGVDGVEFPESDSAVNNYPIAVLDEAENPNLAAEFIAYVQSDAGQTVLETAGFQHP
ncbi:molybdate ABC transporter substrate-binding protein [Glycomyces algeriensis]|uniref:Molybdate-binding protein n=1 Tax=Glycomyces algeriensis TaxID=256037 RepID=A0A9W6G638_9ACTN|nr:molybdate ABC transporter substrate-binding protein [Glycomyces algeriensis]MDA1368443.1 molybdate ABC transporter substrate-binding protein [Glycomyces algeriensis]MDR7353249.1 molybdate transport system substrate-binding protein [Glycomyces algeriensis]GLI40943.1 molybdate-binding protein [Glycomyces algeriensis]